MTIKLLLPILAIEESSGIAIEIPNGAVVEYKSIETVFGVADLDWNGETYFANLDDLLEVSWPTESSLYRSSAWVN